MSYSTNIFSASRVFLDLRTVRAEFGKATRGEGVKRGVDDANGCCVLLALVVVRAVIILLVV